MNENVCQRCGAVGEHIVACKRQCIAPTGCWWPKCACEVVERIPEQKAGSVQPYVHAPDDRAKA